jgi:acetolactate synthase-1/2/3 large subunit
LLLSGGALLAPGLRAAGKLAAATGARVFADRFAARMQCGAGRFAPQRLAYFPEDAAPMLAGLKHLILVEATPPVPFFHYPGRRSELAPEDCTLHVLASLEEDGTGALEALVDECAAGHAQPPHSKAPISSLPGSSQLTPETIGRVLGALMPDGAILSDEMVTSGYAVMSNLSTTVAYDFLPNTGGSIGQGLPVALGAAVACPDRKVFALEADGSAMYTFQALWTMARQQLNVVTVIFANQRYRILDVEMHRTGAKSIGPQANEVIDIGRPAIDWVKLSEAVGVPASRATTSDEFIAQFRAAVDVTGPSLIEAVIP